MRIRGFAPSTPCWAELSSADPVRAAGFYGRLFGWELDGDRFLLDGRPVAGIGPAQADRAEGWLTYLATADLEQTAGRVASAYGRCLTWTRERAGARSTVVTDASGAIFGLWQSTGFAGAQLRGEPGTMAWADLHTGDVGAATSFYGSVFGWTLTTTFGSGEWLTEAHDSVAGIVPGRGHARWQPSFEVADTASVTEMCARLGGRVVSGPVDMGLGSYVEIVDPLGARFAVTAPVERAVTLDVAYNDIIGMELTFGG